MVQAAGAAVLVLRLLPLHLLLLSLLTLVSIFLARQVFSILFARQLALQPFDRLLQLSDQGLQPLYRCILRVPILRRSSSLSGLASTLSSIWSTLSSS